jgi:thiamine kinase-like enzyme
MLDIGYLLLLLLMLVVAVVAAVAVAAPRSGAWRYAFLYGTSWVLARVGQWRATSVPHRIAGALSSSSSMPESTEIVRWVESFLPTNTTNAAGKLLRVEVSKDGLGGGHIGAMFRLVLTWDGADNAALADGDVDRPRTLVVKTLAPGFRLSSILLGSAREAYFYRNFASDLAGSAVEEIRSVVPHVFHADGSWLTGDYVIVMEDLSRTGARLGSHVMGNQCWGPVKDFPAQLQSEEVSLQMLEEVFEAMADVHAAFWRNKSLLQHSWLKSADWLQGRQRARWELAMDGMRRMWDKIKSKIEQGKTSVEWSDEVVRAMDDSLALTSWDTYQRSFDVSQPTTPFTLCHGDFHAANVLWVPGRARTDADEDDPERPRVGTKVYMVDWPEVGIACPFTEVAQFMISNASIELRRKHERRLFAAYHARLLSEGVCGQTFPLEACWERYKRGGVERWLQMLALLAHLGLPDFSITWFHDQVAAFVRDHGASVAQDGSGVPLMSAYALAMR